MEPGWVVIAPSRFDPRDPRDSQLGMVSSRQYMYYLRWLRFEGIDTAKLLAMAASDKARAKKEDRRKTTAARLKGDRRVRAAALNAAKLAFIDYMRTSSRGESGPQK